MAASNQRSRETPSASDRSTAGVGMAHPTVVPRNFDRDAGADDD